MERMILKHLSGSKVNQVEEFPLQHHSELIMGRDASSTVQYDPDRDDLVGRQHAKINRDPNDPNGFLLADMNSRNGTFLNKSKISGTVKLKPGDLVQLGPGGPEFQFDVEPRPVGSAKPTRIADSIHTAPPETRIATAPIGQVNTDYATKPMNQTGKATVGKATVERMINHSVTETKKQEGRKYATIGSVAAVLVLILIGTAVGGAYLYSSSREKSIKDDMNAKNDEIQRKADEMQKKLADDKAAAGLAPSEISDKFANSVVFIECSWRLIDTQNQSQLYHQFVANDLQVLSKILGVNLGKGPINPQAGKYIPVYLSTGKSYEPLLTTEKNASSVPIGGNHMGSGFIVTNDGFILTNRHVASTWMTSYHFPENTPTGIIITEDGKLASNQLVQPPTSWVPSQTKQSGKQYSGSIKGQNDALTVTLNGKENRMIAQLKQASDRHDVALIKVDVPGQLTKVELNDNYDTLKKGEQVTVMGYPVASPPVYGVIKSKDMFNQEEQLLQVPQVTVTTTNIGNILRTNEKDTDNKLFSEYGDVIQLSTNTTGGGNSGGPVFDSQGRVIGIFFAGSVRAGTSITYAVPIRYGKEFLAGQ